MKKDYLDIVLAVLKEAKAPVSIHALYSRAQELYSAGKISQMFSTAEDGTYYPVWLALKNKEDLPFVQVSQRPITIALKEYALNAKSSTPAYGRIETHHERLLHPLLAHFAYTKWGAHTKTIYHEKALKGTKGKNSWLYPDMVGASFTYQNFEPTLRQFVENFGNLPLKLFSFELKKEMDLSHCREYYFQAISNSSWAHEGYLVVEKINTQDSDLMDLLKRLHTSFGIGVVLLNVQDMQKSQVLLNAKFKENLDHAMLGELSQNSPDFKDFLNALTLYHEAIKAHMSEQTNFQAFDSVLDKAALQNYISMEILQQAPKEL
ncbi:HrgA protein [Helicobacter mehlei]|uniref:HrgA protein n=1 Tax=Helicobacter mehlei TaxID=2316080 RepID=A0A553UVE5_9HELI|nr:HrgA protein [Helicobacter mehlei]TSA83971.1 HrgA protein [Helicobacter mehlei]